MCFTAFREGEGFDPFLEEVFNIHQFLWYSIIRFHVRSTGEKTVIRSLLSHPEDIILQWQYKDQLFVKGAQKAWPLLGPLIKLIKHSYT